MVYYAETSAKSGLGVDAAFEYALKAVLEHGADCVLVCVLVSVLVCVLVCEKGLTLALGPRLVTWILILNVV